MRQARYGNGLFSQGPFMPRQKESYLLRPDEMAEWLDLEIDGVTKATELRIKDATDFVTAYALGKLTPEQANERHDTYMRRWGEEPIPGVATDPSMSNEEILRRMDEAIIKERLARRGGVDRGRS
jgi:hypothetical protein